MSKYPKSTVGGSGHGGCRGSGQGGCERRFEVFVKIKKNVSGGGEGRFRVDVDKDLKYL